MAEGKPHHSISRAHARPEALFEVVGLVDHEQIDIRKSRVQSRAEGVTKGLRCLGRQFAWMNPRHPLEESPPKPAPALRLLGRQAETRHAQKEIAVGISQRFLHEIDEGIAVDRLPGRLVLV